MVTDRRKRSTTLFCTTTYESLQHSEADDAVIVNNVLHGLHLNDTEEYRELYYKFIAFLLKEFNDAPIFITLTTSVRNTERECYEMLAKEIPECLKSI